MKGVQLSEPVDGGAAKTADSRPSAAERSGAGSLLGAVLRVRELGIVLALAAVVAYTGASNSRFLSSQSIRDILLSTAIMAVLSVGQAVVVITRNIDLSVGSVLGFTAYAVATFASDHQGVPMVVLLLLGLGIGAGLGVFNGALVRFGRVPALVVTLGTLYIFRSITYYWAGGPQVNADELPDHFLRFANTDLVGIPWLVLIALVIVVAATVVMRNYRVGRELYAMGSDPDAAELAGIAVGRNTIGAFIVSGALAGLAGVMFASRFGTVDASAGTGYELNVVAGVVVGGVAVFGGSGTVWGAALGALLLTVIGSALVVLKIDQFWQQAIVGALILMAIIADRLVAIRVARALKERASHVR